MTQQYSVIVLPSIYPLLDLYFNQGSIIMHIQIILQKLKTPLFSQLRRDTIVFYEIGMIIFSLIAIRNVAGILDLLRKWMDDVR
jgi:hypothetical protein